jgi:hypothetical protein
MNADQKEMNLNFPDLRLSAFIGGKTVFPAPEEPGG